MSNELRELIERGLYVQNLRDIASAASREAARSETPLRYFLILAVSAFLLEEREGVPVDAQVADIQDALLRPCLEHLLELAPDDSELVSVADECIRTYYLRRGQRE
jgi:hypothetical protein